VKKTFSKIIEEAKKTKQTTQSKQDNNNLYLMQEQAQQQQQQQAQESDIQKDFAQAFGRNLQTGYDAEAAALPPSQKPTVCIVIGMAGSGKSTFMQVRC